MNCNKIQSLLSAYADRELTGVEMFLVRQHVNDCDCCRLEEAEMRRVKALLYSMEAPEPSPGFEDRLVSVVMNGRPEPVEVKRVRWVASLATVSLSAAAMACLAYGAQGTPYQVGRKAHSKVEASQIGKAKSGSNMAIALQRDRASINASDPLAGPQLGVAATDAVP